MVREKIWGWLKNTKGGKAAGMDRTVIEMMGKEGIIRTNWFLRIYARCMEYGVVPGDSKVPCIIPMYKEKGDRRECANY